MKKTIIMQSKNNGMRRVTKYVPVIIMGIERFIWLMLAFCIISYAYTGFTSPAPSVFGYRIMYIPTESMEPAIHAGSFALVTRGGLEDLSSGDIAVYKKSGRYIIHRILEIHDDTVIFKGDNNPTEDAPVSRGEIMYRVVS